MKKGQTPRLDEVRAYVRERLDSRRWVNRLARDIAEIMGISPFTVSRHLANLQYEGVLLARGNGPMRQYRLLDPNNPEDKKLIQRARRVPHEIRKARHLY